MGLAIQFTMKTDANGKISENDERLNCFVSVYHLPLIKILYPIENWIQNCCLITIYSLFLTNTLCETSPRRSY